MKKLIQFVYLLILIYVSELSAQHTFHFNTPQQFTGGYFDRNPSYGRRNTQYESFYQIQFDFIAFERKNSFKDSAIQICVAQISENGLTAVTFITNNNYVNINPAIAYNISDDYAISTALVVWESKRNGKSGIYGRVYSNTTGWRPEFPVDTLNVNKNLPNVYPEGDSTFAITYESEGEILFKHLKISTLTFINVINLTESDSAYCSKPIVSRNFAGIPYYLYVSYQRRKSDFENAIYYRTETGFSPINWSVPDTVITTGNNRNSDIYDDWGLNFYFSFENSTTGKWNTMLFSRTSQYNLYTNPDRDNTQLGFFINGDFLDFYVRHYVYREQGEDSIKIKLLPGLNNIIDSITISDTLSNKKITINNATNSKIWVIYDKTIGTTSSLYGVSITNDVITGTQYSEIKIPGYSYLYQNYPNPFNPKTIINYELTLSGHTILNVYDIKGNKVTTLVNKYQTSGKYTVELEGDNLASGIYFYQLNTENFSITKKMLLQK